MKKRIALYIVIILIAVALLVICLAQDIDYVHAQTSDCILVFDDNDDPGYYDTFSYTDPQGRDVCKVRIVFHEPAEGDPNGAVFTESGEVNGYTARFSGVSVDVWRSGSPYSISHTKVWVLEAPTGITPTPTDAQPPTEIPPTDTIPSPTPTYIPPVPTDTPAPGTGTSVPPYPPPPVTNTPLPPTLIPPVQVTYTPGAYPPQEGKPPAPMLPETGMGGTAESSWPLYFGIAILFGLVILVVRGYKKG